MISYSLSPSSQSLAACSLLLGDSASSSSSLSVTSITVALGCFFLDLDEDPAHSDNRSAYLCWCIIRCLLDVACMILFLLGAKKLGSLLFNACNTIRGLVKYWWLVGLCWAAAILWLQCSYVFSVISNLVLSGWSSTVYIGTVQFIDQHSQTILLGTYPCLHLSCTLCS